MNITLIVVTMLSLSLAATMCFVARRMIVEERRRSDARVAALASDIRGGNFEPSVPVELPLRNAPVAADRHDMFATRSSGSRFGVAAIAGVVVVTTATILAIVLSGHGRPAPGPRGAAASTVQSSHVSLAPLELVALSHEREADRITIRGIVRMPAGAAWATHLTAVVLLFNTEGSFVASARADVNERTGQSEEGTFVVTVPGAADVGRYRVSFRTDDHVVPHVDRREGAAS